MIEFTTETLDTGDVIAHMKGASLEAAMAMARIVYAGSQAEVPVDKGRLKASGRIERRVDAVAVMYGGQGVRYAAAVHEGVRGTGVKGVSVKVGKYRRGKSHYLRDPLMKASELLSAGAEAYKEAMAGLAQKTYKSVRAVRNYGPGGGPGSGGDVAGR